jgi:predicted RNA-binding protein with PUA-like domain
MNTWLVKQEPETYPWSQFVKEKGTRWEGVRNFQARNNLRAMKKGDQVLYYHSGGEKAVVGLCKVAREAYPDPTAPGEDWSVVDLVPVKTLPRPIPLATIKATPGLAELSLVRQSRLSVMPVAAAHWKKLLALGGL